MICSATGRDCVYGCMLLGSCELEANQVPTKQEATPPVVEPVPSFVTKPEDLLCGDKLGYFVFLRYDRMRGYLFYQVVGLQHIYLHWQTVNWLLSVVQLQREQSGNSATEATCPVQPAENPQPTESPVSQTEETESEK